MTVKSGKDLLNSVLKTTQMGQIGIRTVLNYTDRPDLKQALRDQLREYDSIEKEANKIANENGWEIKNLNPMVKRMAEMSAHMRLTTGDVDSKIAAMMIQGNTRGSIKTLKNLHRYPERNGQICAISQKLLDCETDNVVQMQGYV